MNPRDAFTKEIALSAVHSFNFITKAVTIVALRDIPAILNNSLI